mgnify:CR=1 FL=1
MVLEQKRIALGNGIELDVVDEGPRDAPVLIFLHGFPESHRTWRHQIAHFSDRFRCIAPDQRGYRGSSKPQAVADYTPDKLVGDIFLLAAALGVRDFTIVGHDWGGAIAWGIALAGQDTGRVTRAVIANAPHPQVFQKLLYTSKVQREASQYMRGFRDAANDALVREHGLGGILMQEIKWDAPDRMEPEERAMLLEDWQDRDAAFAMLNWYRASPIDVPPMDAPFGLPEGWTAHALPNERAAFTAGGMTGFLQKPINTRRLKTALSELVMPAAEGASDATEATHAEPQHPVLNANQVNELFELLGPEKLADRIGNLRQRVEGQLPPLASAEDRDDLQRKTHDLAGLCGMFGAERMHALLATIEQDCKQGDVEKARDQVAKVPAAWAETLDAWEARLSA